MAPAGVSLEVTWGGEVMSFQEVSGLDLEAEPVEYRVGDHPAFAPVGMPGGRPAGTVGAGGMDAP